MAIGVQLVPPLVEDSQFNILPVWPLKESVPLLAPLQTVTLVDTIPGTVTGSTVIVAGDDGKELHTPLFTIARYTLVAVMFE